VKTHFGFMACMVMGGMLETTPSLGADAVGKPPLDLKPRHITALVVDVDRAVRWYQDVLGMTLREKGSREPGPLRFAELSMPAFGVGLVQLPPGVATPRPPGALAPSWLHIVFSVSDLAATKQLLEHRGATVRTREQQGRLEALLVDDSEGNEIEILPDSPGA